VSRIEQSGRMSLRRPKPPIKRGSAPEEEEEEEEEEDEEDEEEEEDDDDDEDEEEDGEEEDEEEEEEIRHTIHVHVFIKNFNLSEGILYFSEYVTVPKIIRQFLLLLYVTQKCNRPWKCDCILNLVIMCEAV